MVVTVAVGAACALAMLSLRSLAFAFSYSVAGRNVELSGRKCDRQDHLCNVLTRRQIAVMVIEITMSFGIALLSIGLAAAAALPGTLLVGALLAQVAVLGALIAPPVLVRLLGVMVRPAALALGVAQLAHLAFFLRAIEALV